MSGIITPSGLVNELTVITDPDTLSEVNVPGEAVNRKIKKSVDRTYFQGTLPGRVAVNEADITSLEGLRDGTEQLNPRSFTSGRFDSQELVSGTLSVSGWYTIAETGVQGFESIASKFVLAWSGSGRTGSFIFEVAITGSNAPKVLKQNCDITKLGSSSSNAPGGASNGIDGVRIVKSDSVNNSGCKIQINVNVSLHISPRIQIIDNIANGTHPGFSLVAPYLDNTPTLPDGVTVGTFLEAGEELSLGFNTVFISSFICFKVSDDALKCVIDWPEIPKQGTGLVFTLPTTLFFRDGAANSISITDSHTISNFNIIGKKIGFQINEVGKFTSLNTGPVGCLPSGTGFKLTIT